MEAKYPLAMRLLHWVIALCILGLIASGWYMEGLADDAPNKYDIYNWHKSFGVLALIFVVVRVVVRLRSVVPELPSALEDWEIKLSHIAHKALYVLMIAVPSIGYIMSSAYIHGKGIPFFGLMLPDVVGKSEELTELMGILHGPLAYTMLAIVVLHAAGAIKHRFIDKDPEADVLKRML